MKISLDGKIKGGFLFALLILSVLGVMSRYSLGSLLKSAHSVAHTQEVIAGMENTLLILTRMESEQRGYLFTGDSGQIYLFRKNIADLWAAMYKLRASTSDNPDQQRRLNLLDSLMREKIAFLEKGMAFRRQGRKDSAAAILLHGGLRKMAAIDSLAGEVERAEQALLAQRTGRQNRVASLTGMGIDLGSLLGTIFLLSALFLIARDMRRRRMAEEELHRSHGVLHAIIEGTDDSIFAKDREDRYLMINSTGARYLGKPAWEIVGRRNQDLLPPEVVEAVRKEELLVMETGKSRFYETALVLDGQARIFHTSKGPFRDKAGEIIGIIGISRDITGDRTAQASLRKSEERFQIVAKATNEVIWDWDLATQELWWNSGVETQFGHPFAGTGRSIDSWLDNLHPEDRVRVESGIRRAIDGGASYWSDEYRFRKADGGYAFVLDRGYILHGEADRPERMIGAMMDISRRHETELELTRAKEAAEAGSRSKSEFLANMSHELRTPLNSVIGFAQILLKNKAGNLREQDLAYLAKINGNGRHLLELINTILDLSKIEAGKMELHWELVDLESLLRDIESQFDGQAQARNLQLRLEIPLVMEKIRADRGKLKQALINLVGNAMKFTESGSVTLRAHCRPESLLPICIEVADTGIGIPGDRQAAVFEAFQQVDNSTARPFGGTGLGLSISRSLLGLMGFGIGLESRPGQGSIFRIDLEERTSGKSRSTSLFSREDSWSPAAPPAYGEKKPILVIDDDPDARLLIRHYLEESGYAVAEAANGRQGLEMARREIPLAITLDLLMPGMDGWSVLKALKSDRELKSIPVVVVSLAAGERRAKTLGPVDFLDKPFFDEQFREILARYKPGEEGGILVVDDSRGDKDSLSSRLLRWPDLHVRLRLARGGEEGLRAAADLQPSLILVDLMMPGMGGLEFLQALRTGPRQMDVPVVVAVAQQMSDGERHLLERQCADALGKGADLEERLCRTLAEMWKETPAKTRTAGS